MIDERKQGRAKLECSEWSESCVFEHAYLVARGVRPMAIVGHIEADEDLMLQAASRLEIVSVGQSVIPFVIRRNDDFADCGFAAAWWVIDLHAWLVGPSDVPEDHAHRIMGLLLGYNAAAIREHDERSCGRRLTTTGGSET